MNLANLDKNKKYLLACSFGPDSMALFYLLTKNRYNFDVAHVNYHLREESDIEEASLRKYCVDNKVTLFVKSVDMPIIGNTENICREIRYDFFKELVDKNGYDAILVAHNLDDHVETYILQKERGILPKYWGIAPISKIKCVKIIRPLLGYRKKELQNLCDESSTPYSIDKTNLSNTYKRNQIRNTLIKGYTDQQFAELVDKIESDNQKLEALFSNIALDSISDIDYLKSVDTITYYYIINALEYQVLGISNLSKKNCDEILKIINSKKPNIIREIKTGLFVIKEYKKLYFSSAILADFDSDYSYVIDAPAELDTPYFYLDFRCDASNRNVSSIDYPLTIRNLRADDEYLINGYFVKAKRLFIDWKMPMSFRKKWPAILNKEGKIIYIPRYQKDFDSNKKNNFFVKVTK